MSIKLRPITEPFVGFLAQARRLLGFWVRFVGSVVVLSLVLGPFAPIAMVAFLLTLGLPILLLVLCIHRYKKSRDLPPPPNTPSDADDLYTEGDDAMLSKSA